MANSAEKKAFIEKMWNAIKGLDLNGLFPSVLIAQAAWSITSTDVSPTIKA